MKPMTLSQKRTFFREMRLAAKELCEQPEEYRKRIMLDELSVTSLGNVSATNGFDKLMVRVATDKGDYELALKYTTNSLIRVVSLVMDVARKIVSVKGGGNHLEYIHGVMLQSAMIKERWSAAQIQRLGRTGNWLDFTEPQVKRLLVILSTHLRRLKA